MIEVDKNFASKGVAGAGLGLGIAGTALGVLNGGLGNVFGGLAGAPAAANACHENTPVNRYELALEQKVAELQSSVALRDSTIFTDSKILELYKYLDGKLEGVNQRLCAQDIWNATQTATIGCMANQIAQLQGLTKLVVPAANICPAPTTTTT